MALALGEGLAAWSASWPPTIAALKWVQSESSGPTCRRALMLAQVLRGVRLVGAAAVKAHSPSGPAPTARLCDVVAGQHIYACLASSRLPAIPPAASLTSEHEAFERDTG